MLLFITYSLRAISSFVKNNQGLISLQCGFEKTLFYFKQNKRENIYLYNLIAHTPTLAIYLLHSLVLSLQQSAIAVS